MNAPDKPKIPMYDLYDLWYEPFWHKSWFWPVVMSLLVLLVCFIIWFVLSKRKQTVVVKTPWQEALDKFAQVDLEHFKDSSKHKQFYSEITLILKNYLSRRYGLILASKTEQEVIGVITSSEFPDFQLENLTAIFQGALFVKFANQNAAFQKMVHDLNVSKGIVESTIPQK